jgi:hypothetical protein
MAVHIKAQNYTLGLNIINIILIIKELRYCILSRKVKTKNPLEMERIFTFNQLPLLPPVFTGFLEDPADLLAGLVINFEPPLPMFLGVLPPLLSFLLVGKDILFHLR